MVIEATLAKVVDQLANKIQEDIRSLRCQNAEIMRIQREILQENSKLRSLLGVSTETRSSVPPVAVAVSPLARASSRASALLHVAESNKPVSNPSNHKQIPKKKPPSWMTPSSAFWKPPSEVTSTSLILERSTTPPHFGDLDFADEREANEKKKKCEAEEKKIDILFDDPDGEWMPPKKKRRPTK